jgi:hypothetical protein
MGQGALRSQMDVRISFRVRERKDVELILGQGMLSAGWHAHRLNAPGKFLISAPEYDTPRRARAYLLTDEAVSLTVTQHASLRPELDEVSRRALDEAADIPPPALREAASHREADDAQDEAGGGAEGLLWAALCLAPEPGIPVADLVAATGRSHRWVNYQLRALADIGRAVQIKRGIWRAVDCDGDAP